MDLNSLLSYLQVATGLLLMLAILVQERGAALSETFGGSGGFFGTRRGGERILFSITIGLAIAFLLLSFLNLLV